MTHRFPHLRAAILQHPWAITPDRLEAIAEVVERRMEGIRLSPEEIAGFKGKREPNGTNTLFSTRTLLPVDVSSVSTPLAAARADSGAPSPSVIAVLSFFGIVAQHASQVDDISGPGGTSTERVTSSFRAAMNDPSVKAIVINFDSPGGNVYGVQALADEIYNARGQKPIVAQVNSLAASAAYWVACACDEIVVTPGGQVGSVGVYALHRDVSKAADEQGVKFTFVSAGKYKVEGNQYEPLSDEAAQALQSQIDSYYTDFVSSVARGRGVKPDDVVNGFGQGRVEKDKAAVKAGMADRVGTMDDTLRRLASAKKSNSAKAEGVRIATTPADAAQLVLKTERTEAGSTTSVVGEFPAMTVISASVIEDERQAEHIDVRGHGLALTFANGEASYQLESLTANGDWICKLVSARLDPLPASASDEAERDAFRRRRHAHRSRNA